MDAFFGGIAQLARAFGSYPEGRGFKSNFRYQSLAIAGGIRPGGQAAKTPPFHGGNTSSILVRVTKNKSSPCGSFCFCEFNADGENRKRNFEEIETT